VTHLSPEVLAWFADRPWPGNVRELRNMVERAVIMASEGEVQLHHLPGAVQAHPSAAAAAPTPAPVPDNVLQVPVGMKMSDVEEAYLRLTLKHTRNNKKRSAEILGLCLRTLHNKLQSYDAGKVRAAAGGDGKGK
jgi:DNA-binding NtrC family response regulator